MIAVGSVPSQGLAIVFDLDARRKSISATLEEIIIGHKQLGLPPDNDELTEAYAIIERIKRALKDQRG